MNTHISNIKIRSFRGIRNLELKDTKLINILTGDNNGGKTSVLEVMADSDIYLSRILEYPEMYE